MSVLLARIETTNNQQDFQLVMFAGVFMYIFVFALTTLILPFALPSFIGILILRRYWQDEPIRLLGLLNLVFVASYIFYYFSWLSWPVIDGERPYLYIAIISIAPAIIILGIFLYVYRRLFVNQRVWLFMIGNLLYWLNIILIHGDFVLGIVRWLSIAIMLSFPSLYAILSWLTVKKILNSV